jgi:ribose transport system ATP-binding protein
MGVVFVSGDRARAGGVLSASLGENLSAPRLRYLRGPFRNVSHRKEALLVDSLIDRFGIRPTEARIPFSQLSGGNQQKALLGRWMSEPPAVLLLDEPTAGVDVGAVDGILTALEAYVGAGGAIVIASTQYEDLVRLADRVLVFVAGRVIDEVRRAAMSPQTLLARSYGDIGLGASGEATEDPGDREVPSEGLGHPHQPGAGVQ